MNAHSPEGTLRVDRKNMQGEPQQRGYQWSQTAQPVAATEAGGPSASVWATAIAAVLAIGTSFRELLQQGAPAGEPTFKRQML